MDSVFVDSVCNTTLARMVAKNDMQVEIIEIEFFQPQADSTGSNVKVLTPLQNQSVKRITTTTIATKSVSQQSVDKTENRMVRSSEQSVITDSSSLKPAPDPYRWRYIFYSLLAICAILIWWLYIRR